MYSNKVRNIELPENLFSNLGEMKSKKIEQTIPVSIPSIKENILNNKDIKLTNYNQKHEYRSRISKMYDELQNITPIDNEINSTLYLDNYSEKGIVIKPQISSLKQFWTEYRLINNEKNATTETYDTLDDFDKLFASLTKRVEEINDYIAELKEMRSNIHISKNQLQEAQSKFNQEKQDFMDYKEQEEHKIKAEKENLKINFDRLQTIINDLDKNLNITDK